MAYTKEFNQYVSELIDADWRTVRTIAAGVGITSKPDDESWNDQAEAIALAVFKRDAKPIHIETVVEPASQPDQATPSESSSPEPETEEAPPPQSESPRLRNGKYATAALIAAGHKVCLVCGAQWQTGKNKQPICPEGRGQECPRLNPAIADQGESNE